MDLVSDGEAEVAGSLEVLAVVRTTMTVCRRRDKSLPNAGSDASQTFCSPVLG